METPQITVPYIRPDGTTIQAKGTLITPIELNEPWGEYRLEDGTIVRTRQILTQLIRLDEEKAPNGEPIYLSQFQAVISVIPSNRK